MIDKRDHIAGNVYTEQVEGIHVHRYGAHIFHTNNKTVWDYITRFAEFNRFTNSPVANYKGNYIACLLTCTRSIRSGCCDAGGGSS